MRMYRSLIAAAALACVAAATFAQPGQGRAGQGPGGGPMSADPASPGTPAARGPQGRAGRDFTPGWSLMSAAERREHQNRLREMKTYEECAAYMEQHRIQMAERAQARGTTLPTPRRDACASLKR